MHIEGPSGPLEFRLDPATSESTTTAVLCHPHPQYGGSMHDAVLETAVKVLTAHGVNCLRFNFRGVGASAGSYDDGLGEAQDLLAVSAAAAEEYPQDQIWWLGYSFGASVVWRALQQPKQQSAPRGETPRRSLLIAPPLGVMDFSLDSGLAANEQIQIDAVAGDQDNFVDAQKFRDWPGVATHLIVGADHFFSGHYDTLANTLTDVLFK